YFATQYGRSRTPRCPAPPSTMAARIDTIPHTVQFVRFAIGASARMIAGIRLIDAALSARHTGAREISSHEHAGNGSNRTARGGGCPAAGVGPPAGCVGQRVGVQPAAAGGAGGGTAPH